MDQLIVHHFDASPFAEKVRLILGFKGLDWVSVKIPMIMPKPDVVALSGGYRKTPILQVGADVYCDTALIARVLDARAPEPTLFPAGAPLAPLLAQWADWTLFWTVVDFASQPAAFEHRFRDMPPDVVKAIVADRTPFRAPVPSQTAADAAANLGAMLAALDTQLADDRRFLFCDASIADFSVAHCLWHLRRAGPVADVVVGPHRALVAWHDRMLALGHGTSMTIESSAAIEIAAGANGHAPTEVEPGLGFNLGDPVSVSATDYGTDPVTGTLVGLTPREVVVEPRDERAGNVHVHFPRSGFQIKANT